MTVGNLVGPSSGALATVVSQDPMYVVFSIATRRAIELRSKLSKEGFNALKVRGKLYEREGLVGFIDINVAQDTDTILLRGTIPNPPLGEMDGQLARELINEELVTVLLQDAAPAHVVAVPRHAILSDQGGNHVYVVDRDNVARRRDLKLGATSPEWAAVETGLTAGERIVVDGLQRVRPDAPVLPEPATTGDASSVQAPRG